ncbi:hypothetical protein [Micromonospora parathelypteridis]|uniref:Uncharacterized membrane protein HdeD (DUF308 family) n=1 Tax=Micromonospora parathelypteridis TaxID=1839617 RepID=A0A840W3P6_9ACTN|nr:hypothetical protein [Micromonospora parathelypteridis]MBB5479410.1 uncharacterized membrane protein HdeD (DUF308 family) [Micromonospora parathelypteridis]GGO29773.1 hypothetical protein GCM10011576_56700 [Micromonospora parathelypteridis]
MIRTLLARVGLVAAAACMVTLSTAAPAAAHGADAPDGTDYRTRTTGVTPARPGLEVRVVEAGARLELSNSTGRTIEVIGYSGEPYLRVGPDGVFENSRSPATYLNRTIAGDTALPAEADPAAPPSWRRVSDEPTVRWHDQRALWQESAPPAEVRAAPDREHRVRDWAVPLRDGADPVMINGTLDWVPPPDAYTWWAVTIVGLLAMGALGLVAAAAPAGARALSALGALLVAGGVVAVVYPVGRELDAGAQGLGGVALGLLSGQIWSLLTGLGAIAAGWYALARRPAADFAVALAGACLALFSGAANAAVFARSIAPVPWSPEIARVMVAAALITGTGATSAGVLRLHATAKTPTRTRTPTRP